MKVECSNCGGGWELWVAVAALVVALVALFIATKQFGFASTEHREFLKELRARARLRLTPRWPQFPDGVVRSDGTGAFALLEIGIHNDGERAARDVVVNVLVPRWVLPRWTGPNGEELEPRPIVAETDERLLGSDGQEHEAHYVSQTIPRISRRPGHVLHATVIVGVGERLPVRVKAQSDDLPDDVDEVVVDTEIRWEEPTAP